MDTRPVALCLLYPPRISGEPRGGCLVLSEFRPLSPVSSCGVSWSSSRRSELDHPSCTTCPFFPASWPARLWCSHLRFWNGERHMPPAPAPGSTAWGQPLPSVQQAWGQKARLCLDPLLVWEERRVGCWGGVRHIQPVPWGRKWHFHNCYLQAGCTHPVGRSSQLSCPLEPFGGLRPGPTHRPGCSQDGGELP